jgi:sortase (surface protein transpeptidase)
VPADRRVAAGLAWLTLALALGACGQAPARPEASPPVSTTRPATTKPATTRPATPAPTRRPHPPSVPVRLVIPVIGVATPLVRLGLEPGGAMQVPGDFATAGWFAGGPVPGQLGPAVIAGHVDSRTGPAVFYRLGDLRPGDPVRVRRADGDWLAFEVTGTARYSKAAFPTDAVFGPVTGPVLRLVTCGGDFDRASGHYLDNLVVTARPAGGS